MAPVIGATNSASATNFIYQNPANIMMANRLPAALEITAISVDTQAVTQLASTDFAAANPISGPSDVPVAATNYLQKVYSLHVPSARLFHTVLRLPEAN